MPKSATLKNLKSRSNNSHSHKVKSGSGYDLVVTLLELLLAVKFYHWRTSSYSTHKATDELYGGLNDSIDEFAETLMGAVGTRIPAVNKLQMTIPTDNKQMSSLIDTANKQLAAFKFDKLGRDTVTTTDLSNIRDEIVGKLHQTKYLLTLNGSA